MIFNPYDWSTVVNCTINFSLISALIGLSLLNNLKFNWDDWHSWMKRNAEVATNIERQDSERGSEEVNRNCMRRFPVIEITVTAMLGLWPLGNFKQFR